MKKRNKYGSKLIACLLSVLMVFTMMPGVAFATGEGQTGSIKAYVTIANKGEFVTAKDGTTKVVNQAVTVTDKDNDGKYTLNDVFISAHDEFYKGGAEAGYASADGSVSKLWGDSSGAFGYYQNNISSWSPIDPVASGDSVYAYIYKDTAGWSDKYSYFDKKTAEVAGGEAVEITLKYSTMWGESDVAYKNAAITINGEETPYSTDEGGKATIYFDKAGKYFISSKGADGDILAPPFCTVTVTGNDANAQSTVDSDKDALTIDTENLKADLVLPTKGTSGKTLITWQTSDAGVITADGKITRGTTNQTAKLTATITYGTTSIDKVFDISVAAISDEDILNSAAELLGDGSSIELVEFTGETDFGYEYESEAKDTNILTKIKKIINEQFSGVNVSIKTGFTENSGFEQDGTIKYIDKQQTAEIPVTLSIGDQKKEVPLTITIPEHAKTKAEAVEELKQQITLENILNGQEQDAVKDKLVLPTGDSIGIGATWYSDSNAISITGSYHNIMRPAYGESAAPVKLTATFAYDSMSQLYGMCNAGPMPQDAAMTFNVKVAAFTKDEYDSAQTEIDGLLNSFDNDTIVYFANQSQKADLSGITENLFLPDLGTTKNGIKTTWTSDDTALISSPSSGTGKAAVTRPEKGQNDANCNLKITLSKNSYTANKVIPVTVKAVTEEEIATEQAKVQEIADALTFEVIKKENTSADYVTTQLNLWRSASKENGKIEWAKRANPTTGYAIDWEYTDNVKQYGNITRGENDVAVNLKATVKSADKPYTTPVNVTIPMTILGQGETPQSKYLEKLNPIMENIATVYKNSSDSWKVIDMSAYALYNPDTQNKITDKAKQEFINSAIDTISTSEKDTDLSKVIIALTGIGADVTELYPVNSDKPISAIDKLNAVEQSSSLWRAPYTLMAYNQGEYDDSAEKENALVKELLEKQQSDGSWEEYGTVDTTANAIAALAFYSNKADARSADVTAAEIKKAIEDGVNYLSTQQKDSGAFDGGYGENSNSTAMVIIGLAAAGVDPATDARFIQNGNSVMDGLLKFKTADNSGFGYTDNTKDDYATEQSFRALIAAAQVMKTGKAYNIYDFSANAVEPAKATAAVTPDKPGNQDKPTGNKTENGNAQVSDANTGNTGDEIPMEILIAVALMALICAAVCVYRRKENNRF